MLPKYRYLHCSRTLGCPSIAIYNVPALLPPQVVLFTVFPDPGHTSDARPKSAQEAWSELDLSAICVCSGAVMGTMGVACSGPRALLFRHCVVDCGLQTGCFCDYCLAVSRLPNEDWAPGQMTPLCASCDSMHNECHFCRGLQWCVPPPWNGDNAQ